MIDWFRALDPAWQALLAGLFTLGLTALGAGLVAFGRDLSEAWLDAMLGFAAGVMIAASFWSLIVPAIEYAEAQGTPGWLPAAVGVLAGAGAIRLADHFLPHLHPRQPMEHAEGLRTAWQRSTLLVLAITLHNVPEGLAVGVAFGAASGMAASPAEASLGGAMALALGIGLQNFPEGAAVSMPLRGAGLSRRKSFAVGAASAAVEPIAAVIGAVAVGLMRPILPYALTFAAGAMLYVVIEELIPDSQEGGHHDLATGGAMLGFVVMMVLDVALG